ncbi:MAG: hypothetical protein JRC77_03980, partial [Deltaproteobacteria bacterium]|nr:hypothetical protein [Deltaproteobacteria bacterium]
MTSLRVGMGLTSAESTLEAAPAAARLALEHGGFEKAGAAVCALIPGAEDNPGDVVRQLASILGTEVLLVLCVEQLMDGTREVREEGSACVFALEGAQARLSAVADLVGEEIGLGPALLADLGGSRGTQEHKAESLVLLGFDCLRLSPALLQKGLSEYSQSHCVVGLGVSPVGPENCAIWAGLEPIHAGAAALVL